MDIASIVTFLAPYLPSLLNVGSKVAEGAYQQAGADGWDKAKAIWGKLQPKVEAKEAAKEAAADVAQKPEDEDLQASLRVQLKKILDADTTLAEEIAQILQATKSNDSSVNLNAQAYGESIQINTAGNVNNPTYDLRRYDNPK
ncbi:hypothetical protein GNE08_23000 [Trichormus variabilis ARAD]|uniref:Uncharacterized protein n=1 Tax=Trichormus variabilis N2B TaxID=2681315 RepID=A0ABR6SFK4_ANAVA|nr:hypothetical protein [Trichormus variabilis ARAD]MBC1256915.1 hypothetical protein [Trichormus variabilis V5]MBC1269795.1 hypothetical protein [Trichormus variabilis FSR]MBC1305172.1 hypothetical protein [Trichormus variabilis N2B]MBC1314074.1 hypothetical protein [Trichormus variabilis PNB]MBC1329444.1 hypothetical protein [Trichormus variabilis 9RC]MBD2382814.1 hypothetical protein [Trichormus variabilis FACHB-319]